MTSNTVADFLIRIKNGYKAGLITVSAPYSSVIHTLAQLLWKNGYLTKVEVRPMDKVRKDLVVNLAYQNKKARLTDIENVSTASHRVYVKKNEIPYVLGGLGITILSTPQGLMTGKEARKKGIGGEVICKVW